MADGRQIVRNNHACVVVQIGAAAQPQGQRAARHSSGLLIAIDGVLTLAFSAITWQCVLLDDRLIATRCAV